MQNPFHTSILTAIALAAALLTTGQAVAEVQQSAPPDVLMPTPARGIDVTFGAQHLSSGFGNWRSLMVHGVYEVDQHVVQGELSARREFGVNGRYFGIGDTVTLDPDWFVNLAVGAGDGAFFLPRYRIDGAVSRKFLPQKNLVASISGGFYDAPDGHRDRSLGVSAAYYFTEPVVLEAGVRYNRSNPGSVLTHQQFLATTVGRNHEDLVAARIAWGSEGYLPLAPNTSLVGFNSTEFNLSWRHWLTKRMGLLSAVSHYRNPTYLRSGLDVGAFFEFD